MSINIYNRDGDLLIDERQMNYIQMGDGAYDFTQLRDVDSDLTLDNADLSELNLSGSKFNGMTINNALFRDSQLQQADMFHSEFFSCDFDGADLQHANFTGSKLWYCELENTNLHGTVMEHADLLHSSLAGAADIKKASSWHALARGNGQEVTVMQLGEKQVTFVLDWAFVACQGRPVHEFMSMDDAALLEHGGKDWLRWWRKYKSTLLSFIDAHNVRAADL